MPFSLKNSITTRVAFCLFGLVLYFAASYDICSKETGNGICPDGNTCCRMSDGRSGCIPSDMGASNATCCHDADHGDSLTGCPEGYSCRVDEQDCQAIFAVNSTHSKADPLTRILPRYRLCNADEISTVHGLVVNQSSSNQSFAEIPYYSNMGPIEHIINASSINMALIVVHGAGRNGDDYFCSAKATVALQDRYSRVLILALIYYSETDARYRPSFLYWDAHDSDGNWRYGADSNGPVRYSSFSVLDQVVVAIQQKLTNLHRITIAGHSSGGQLVQRWGLLSSLPHTASSQQQQQVGPLIQIIVANPSNYAYLSPYRYVNGAWRIPVTSSDCPHYNQWEWGLQEGGIYHVPYRDSALDNVTAVLERYMRRNVYYLVGGLDRCNVSDSHPGWCHSHGLETTCMDRLQGGNRLERTSRFLASVAQMGYGIDHHRRIVVPDVGHDHSLMFASQNGIRAIYYGFVDIAMTEMDYSLHPEFETL